MWCASFCRGVFRAAQPTGRALSEGREITMAMAEMFNVQLREMQLDPTALELAAAAAFGSVSAATDWWLGPNRTAFPGCLRWISSNT